MSYLNEEKRAAETAPLLLAILEQPGDFNELFSQYAEADGLVDGEFLDKIGPARELWQRANDPAAAVEILALPLAFREAVFFGLQRDLKLDVLAACLNAAAEKTTTKSLKRLLYELKQKGHDVRTSPQKKVLFQRQSVVVENPLPCFTSHTDGRNERILIVNESLKSGVRTLQIYERGGSRIMHHVFNETSRKKLKQFVTEMKQVRGLPLVEIGAPEAHFFLKKLRARMAETQTPEPSGFATAVGRLTVPPEISENHPYRDHVDGQKVLERLSDLGRSEYLHNEPEFRYWMVDRDTVVAFQNSLQEMETSGLVVSADQKRDQINVRIDRAVDAFFTPRARADYADRLRDEALFLARRGAVSQAETSAALALFLDDEKKPASGAPFFRAMLAKVFGGLDEPAAGEEEPGSQLIP
jgi:hypothetical protein